MFSAIGSIKKSDNFLWPILPIMLMLSGCTTPPLEIASEDKMAPLLLTFDKEINARAVLLLKQLDKNNIAYRINSYAMPAQLDANSLIYPESYQGFSEIKRLLKILQELEFDVRLEQSPYKNNFYSDDKYGLYLFLE